MAYPARRLLTWVPLSTSNLFNFTRSADVCIIRVHSAGFSLPNTKLAEWLDERYESIAFGQIAGSAFDPSAWWFSLVSDQLQEIGLPGDRVPPGYYALFDGRVVGWFPGNSAKVKEGAKLAGAATGVFRLLQGKDISEALLDGWKSYETVTGAEQFSFFNEVLDEAFEDYNSKEGDDESEDEDEAEAEQEQRRARQRNVYRDGLSHAYATLGVRGEATDAEVKRAYRRLTRNHHPDRGGDKVAMQKINEAYELIRSHREI